MDKFDRDDQKFDRFLKTRAAPDAPSNLAYRIIEESRATQQDKQREAGGLGALSEKFRSWLQVFDVPQPALVMGAFVVLAVGFGVFTTLSSSEPQQGSEDVSLAFYVDDIFGYEADYL